MSFFTVKPNTGGGGGGGAPAVHTHPITDIVDLQQNLNDLVVADETNTNNINQAIGMINTNTQSIADSAQSIMDIQQAIITNTQSISDLEVDLGNVSSSSTSLQNDFSVLESTVSGHTASIAQAQADIVALQQGGGGGGGSTGPHRHEISDINDLQTALNSKTNQTDFLALRNNFNTHTHTIAQVTGLQAELNDKLNSSYRPTWANINGRPTSTVTQLDNAVRLAHEHGNLPVLELLEDGNGVLVYNGTPLGEVSYLAVPSVVERDAIPLTARKEGLMVLTINDGSVYFLRGGIDNAFWQIFATGAGGATNASTLASNPIGTVTATNAQEAIEQLYNQKAGLMDVYTRAQTDNILANQAIDYATLVNTPDLTSLHSHMNKDTLDLFSQSRGQLVWNGKSLGDLLTEIYDTDGNGIIDKAESLEGMTATVAEVNHLSGVTSNIQAQINSISSGVTYRGEFTTYADALVGNPNPTKGDLVYIINDENNNATNTQYIHDGVDWVYGGGTANVPDATLTTRGAIQLGGDLAHPLSSATAPRLTPTGVTAGTYNNPTVVVDEAGRVTSISEGTAIFLNDSVISSDEAWSSQKISEELGRKSNTNHTHAQLHDANMLGRVRLEDVAVPDNSYVPTYNAVTGQAEWKPQQGGKVYVGSKSIEGSYTLKAGAYITLLIDEVTKEITISTTFRENGGNVLPTGLEVVESVTVPSGGKVRFSKETGFNKVMLHTIQVQNNKDVQGETRIYNQSSDGLVEYNSNPEKITSDIVNIPIFDNDNSRSMHFEIENQGTEEAVFTVRAKLTNLL